MNKIVLIVIFTLTILSPVTGYCNDAVVLKYTDQVEVSEKKCILTETVIIQINNSKGDDYTNFNIPYSDNFKLKKLTGQIRDINAVVIRKLSNKDILTTSAISNSTFYSDNFVKRFSLKHNTYPYIIEVEYQYEISPYFHIIDWDPTWNKEINTLDAELIVTFPPGFEFKTKTNNIDQPVITENEKGEIYKWQSMYTKLKNNDIFAPPINDSLPSVALVPLHFNYIKPGSFDSWKSMGEWELSIDKGLDDLTPVEMTNIDQLTKGITDPRKIVSLLYHYMQDNTRYIFVNIDLGGLQPYPASYVCNNRFGDCKALTNYMKAMLTYKGIPSNKVFVHAGDVAKKIYSDFPSHQSNHVFLAVPFPNDTIWLECTSNFSPVNYLGTFTQNRPVLWVEPNNSRLVKTHALKKEEVATNASYRFSTAENGLKTKLEASYKLRGDLFESVMANMKNNNEKEKRDYFNRFLSFKNYQTEQYKIVTADRDSNYVTYETNGLCNSPFQTIGEYMKVELPPLEIPVFEKVRDRESPVRIYKPLAQVDTIYFSFDSSSFELTTDKQVLVESSYGKLKMDLSIEGDQLKVIRKYEIPIQDIPLDQYKNFYGFIDQLNTKGESIYYKTLTTKNHEKN